MILITAEQYAKSARSCRCSAGACGFRTSSQSTRFCMPRRTAASGTLCRSASATGSRSTPGSAVGTEAAFSSICSRSFGSGKWSARTRSASASAGPGRGRRTGRRASARTVRSSFEILVALRVRHHELNPPSTAELQSEKKQPNRRLHLLRCGSWG